jgi:hypothetical protein
VGEVSGRMGKRVFLCAVLCCACLLASEIPPLSIYSSYCITPESLVQDRSLRKAVLPRVLSFSVLPYFLYSSITSARPQSLRTTPTLPAPPSLDKSSLLAPSPCLTSPHSVASTAYRSTATASTSSVRHDSSITEE